MHAHNDTSRPTIADLLEQARHHHHLADRLTAARIILTLADGSRLSVIAGTGAYCHPRDCEGPYTAVEVGAWSPIHGEHWRPDDGEHSPDGSLTVYGFVPVGAVDAEIARRGGVVRATEPMTEVTFYGAEGAQ